jgi:uncharacterized protein
MIKRSLFESLRKHLSEKEISLIVGPRQAGKTTLMLMLKDCLDREGKKTLFLSLDSESDQPHFASQAALIRKTELEIGKGEGYVFVDEIQRKENAGLFLKGLYDLNLPYKFIVSGSGSLELKEKVHESLVGRKRLFELGTLSFDEFADFRTGYRYEGRLTDFFAIEEIKTRDLLTEYLSFGGYPRLVLEDEMKEKRRLIDEIYRSYLERDVGYLLKVEKTEAFSSLIRILASQTGKMINYSELSSTLGISLSTVKNYLWYGERTFVLQRVTPYFTNMRKEITKSPVVYFHDLGLRNYAVGIWGNLMEASGQAGYLFQNFILNLLRQRLSYGPAEIHFWRTKDRSEVDFVIDFTRGVIPLEVKFKALTKPGMGRSLRNFIRRYTPKTALVVNLTLREKVRVNGTEVEFLPYCELMSIDLESLL